MRKPANLLYGVNDKPPFGITLVLGLQHVFIIFISLILPVLIVQALGNTVTLRTAESYISLSMLAGGIVTILQALRKGPLGSGYLCPSVCGPSYLSASLLACGQGGMPLLLGMTFLAGFIETGFSRVMHRLRVLFPPEVTGVVVMLVGVVIIPMSVKKSLGVGGAVTAPRAADIAVAAVTLATMVGINVWGKGRLRLYGTLIGMVLGYIAAFVGGTMPASSFGQVADSRWFAVPSLGHVRWSFDLTLLIPFIVATICSTVKTVGDLVTCQKINDADWVRPDMKTVAGGIMADGLGGVIPGLIGGFGQSTSSSNIGLSIATGVTSRRVAFAAGLIVGGLAFLPKLAMVFIIMPAPVMGATLIFAVSFMIMTGLQILMSRMLDARKIFMAGISIIFGLSADMAPELYRNMHPWIQPVFSSSLALGAVSALVLNLVLRIGIAKQKTLDLASVDNASGKIFDFMELQGGAWGARKDVIFRAASAVNESCEAISRLKTADTPVRVTVRFDEFNLDADVVYEGTLLDVPEEPPSKEEIIQGEDALVKLSGYLIHKEVDGLRTSSSGNTCRLHLHFNH